MDAVDVHVAARRAAQRLEGVRAVSRLGIPHLHRAVRRGAAGEKYRSVTNYNQCCGSGSAWIRNFCLDPDPE